jgi:coenzyme F420-reducing hydrogenase delta subunit
MRLDYPANVKIIRVPCSGKVDALHLLRAIQKGADGAYVVGCLEGTCHYNEGNFRARERVEYVRTLLEEIGMEADRVRMYNLSSGEGPTFAAYAQEMTEHIRSLGPNPLNDKSNPKKNIEKGGNYAREYHSSRW